MLDIESGGAAETSALDLLATLVAEPTLASATWTLLIAHGQQLAVDRSGTERAALQRHLVANRLGLLAIVDYRADIARLEVTTNRELSSLDAGLVTIPGPAGAITIDRAAITDLYIAAAAGPLLVVGDPGCGKTVALHGLARHLLEHRTVLFLPVGSFAAGSIGALRSELGLDHEAGSSVLEPSTSWRTARNVAKSGNEHNPASMVIQLECHLAGLDDPSKVAAALDEICRRASTRHHLARCTPCGRPFGAHCLRARNERDHLVAAEEMFERTDHHLAPWDQISGEQKRFARVRVVETAIHRVEQGMARWARRMALPGSPMR